MYASVALDIASRSLGSTFDYEVLPELVLECTVGTTVLVHFSGRLAVGYVLSLHEQPSTNVSLNKILPVERVLAPSAFDEVSAKLACWITREYACPLSEALRLFLAPGQSVKVHRTHEGAPWELVCQTSAPIDERWVSLTPAGSAFEPRSNASRQKAVLAALCDGPLRMAELAATLPGSAAAVQSLAKRDLVHIELRRHVRGSDTTSLSSARATRPKHLTHGQTEALAAIAHAQTEARGDVVLIDGVTGSGKTEVYLAAIEATLKQGKGALVLVPEISLTAQTVGRFRSRFGERVAVLHSRLSVGERFDQWDLVRQNKAQVVVGARSALFAPLYKLGLIIIDEEHEWTYKQESAPRYHAREVAAYLARLRGCALVLGSATPSLESLARCKQGSYKGLGWTRVSMPERPGHAVLPKVRIVDMTQQFSSGNRSIFSAPLQEALEGVVERREKAVLLLNRRGFASFLMCRECGAVPECPHCSVALTYHERGHELVCHSCGRAWPQRAFPDPSTRCPNCGSRYMAAFGVGTQRVEDELRALVADRAEIIRMDADTTKNKGGHQRLLEAFDDAECAILVGTQMIAKGLDFPEVTLVGVINADTTLKLPDFRAGERSYELLEQVAGRAGRGERPGEVLIQSYWAGHPAIQAVARHERSIFSEAELRDREDGYYPPYSRVANIIVWGTFENQVRRTCDEIAMLVRACIQEFEKSGQVQEALAQDALAQDALRGRWEVLGPTECVKAKLNDKFRRHIMIKAPLFADLGPLLMACVDDTKVPRGINIAIDVDAYDLM